MIKILLILIISIFALNDATVPNTFSTGEKIYASQFNQNFDTIETWIAKTNDSLDEKFIRFSDLNGGDSTLRVDTVYGGSSVWTGISIIDSLVVTKQIQGNIKGNLVGNVTGNITGNVTGNISGATGTFTGTVVVDSLKSTKQVQANLKGNVTGNVTGNLTGNVTGNVSGTAATVTVAAQPSITSVGTLTGLTVSGTSTFDSTRHRTITTSGRIGIGLAAPGNPLEVKSAGASTSAIAVQRSGGAQQIIRLYEDANGNGRIRVLNSGGNDRIYLAADSNSYIAPDNGGKLGIGTATPAEKLQVNGNIKADTLKGAVQGNVVGNVTGNVSGTAATVTGAAQSAITSVGTLTGLTMGGNITTSTNDIITDSVYARTLTTSGNVNTGNGDVTTDSVYARTLTTSGNVNTGSGDVTTDSVYARTLKASGKIIADSLQGSLTTLTSLTNTGLRTIKGSNRSLVEIVKDTIAPIGTTIIPLFSGAGSVLTYVGEAEIRVNRRIIKYVFSWYGQNGASGLDTLQRYDLNPASDGGTYVLVNATGSPSTLGLSINVGAERTVTVYVRYFN